MPGSIKRNQAGSLSVRQALGFAVLSVALAAASWLTVQGRVLFGWFVGAAGFSVAALIAGHEIDIDDEDNHD